MGQITSRFNFEALQTSSQRSQQDETLYSYSLNKNYFSNFFIMGGERFEVNDPDYLFGDNCDLNFLSCTKPYSLPYKKAQQNLLSNLNTKQKSSSKVSSRVNRLSSPLNILTGRHRDGLNQRTKQDAQTQTLQTSRNDLNDSINGPEPSRPLVMLINIRKETLRLVRTPAAQLTDSDQASDNGSVGYNIEFNFDTEIDCSVRIFYFCTRETNSSGITYKPTHATYKSKIYNYKKGLNQRFDQQEHTFQPHLFDEDLLIYKPIDLDGNYNSGAVFPIVIHLTALEGPLPRQSHSLVATVEKSQLDESYSIKPLKQLIFADSVQYILQDIYGIENKKLANSGVNKTKRNATIQRTGSCASMNVRYKSKPLQTNSNAASNSNLYDTISVNSSIIEFNLGSRGPHRGSQISTTNNFRSLNSDTNTFECVICMSEERDTMLLPCRHLCLCGSCLQSLRWQANSCPICRCSFKAALNLRTISKRGSLQQACSNQQQQSVNHESSLKPQTDSLHQSSLSLKNKASGEELDNKEAIESGVQHNDVGTTTMPMAGSTSDAIA